MIPVFHRTGSLKPLRRYRPMKRSFNSSISSLKAPVFIGRCQSTFKLPRTTANQNNKAFQVIAKKQMSPKNQVYGGSLKSSNTSCVIPARTR